ncbi:13854_t:CDS:2 [Funneliformis geosporum]|nr:13854_t:CDS:2 [Funneliformis geosporum]
MTKVVQSTKINLASAYDLVLADLFLNLKKMKEGVIKLGDLGNLQKKQRIIRSALNGKTYAYYQLIEEVKLLLKNSRNDYR